MGAMLLVSIGKGRWSDAGEAVGEVCGIGGHCKVPVSNC